MKKVTSIICLILLIVPARKIFAQDAKLKGTIIGTEAAYDYDTGAISTKVNTIKNAFDGDFNTFVATYDKSHAWVGLDLGKPYVITRVGWCPRNASIGPKRVQLGLFEGSNTPDFVSAIPLYLIQEEGTIGIMSYADVNVSRGFRYIRWCAPADSRCNIAELEFYGHEGEGDDSQFYQITNLPTLSYHTYNGREPYDKVTNLEAEMCLIYDEGTHIQEYPILARERGNGSRDGAFLKRPYRIKFNDQKSHHMLKDSPLESPAKCKKWVLMPNWREKSLMRNNIAFEMGRRIGMAYVPWCQGVDVIVNGEYKGNYQLADQVTVDKNRVNVTEMTPEDQSEPNITGGYLLEIDAYAGSEPCKFTTNKGMPVTVKYPVSDAITAEQLKYIRNTFNEMEGKLFAANFKDETRGYRSAMDLKSFLQFFIVGEFAGNTDTFYSVNVFKERNDNLFYFGPVWDYDLSMDNDNRVYPTSGKSNWLYNYGSTASGMPGFINRILSDPYAIDMLYELWSEARKSKVFSRESLFAYIDSLGNVLNESAKLNFTRWDNLGELLTLQHAAPGTYQGELDYIKKYIETRIEWIDNKLGFEFIEEINPEDTLYAISTPQQLISFIRAINKDGRTNLHARLDADIDVSSVSSKIQPIGTEEYPYEGTFDGQDHIITGLNINQPEQDNVGFFGTITGGAKIMNTTFHTSCSISGCNSVGIVGTIKGEGEILLEGLGYEGTITATEKQAGAILGSCGENITNLSIRYCYTTGKVTAQSESAAIAGWIPCPAILEGCYSTADVRGFDKSAGFVRQKEATLTRCFDTKHTQTKVSKVTDTTVARGELCFRLHNHDIDEIFFYQTIGKDDHPVLLHHEEVLRKGTIYTNKTDFDISTPEEWIEFAERVNSGSTSINAHIQADIDFKGYTLKPAGTADNLYTGTFDGHGHVFSNVYIHGGNYTGLFGYVGGGCTIKDLTMDNTCRIEGGAYVAGFAGGSNGSGKVLLECLGYEGTVYGTAQNAAAIIGCNMSSKASYTIRNCYCTGDITGQRESGALTGYIGSDGIVQNCYTLSRVEGDDGTTYLYRGQGKDTNSYSIAGTQGKRITTDMSESGELCYLLNGSTTPEEPIWYQTLGEDSHPVLLRSHGIIEKTDEGYQNKEGNGIYTPQMGKVETPYRIDGTKSQGRQSGIYIYWDKNGHTTKKIVK